MPAIKARSIGSRSSYNTGTLSIDGTGLIVTLSGGTFNANWGEGDLLTIDNEVGGRHILSRVSANQVTLQTATAKTGSGLSFSIERAYTTIGAWETACPPNLRTDDSIWKGVMYSDSNFTEIINIQGMTAGYLQAQPNDEEWYVLLTAAAGHEQDGTVGGAGVTIRRTGSPIATGAIVTNTASGCRVIIEKIRIVRRDHLIDNQNQGVFTTGSRTTIRKCLCVQENITTGNATSFVKIINQHNGSFYNKFHNNVYINNSTSNSSSSNAVYLYGAGLTGATAAQCLEFYNNTVIARSTIGALENLHQNVTGQPYRTFCQNNYVINLGAGADYTFGGVNYTNATSSFTNNASDDTSAGTSNDNMQVTFANAKFKVETVGSQDLRLLKGSLLIGEGVNLSTTFTDDNQGVTRTVPWDIGAFKYIATLIGSSWYYFANRRGR